MLMPRNELKFYWPWLAPDSPNKLTKVWHLACGLANLSGHLVSSLEICRKMWPSLRLWKVTRRSRMQTALIKWQIIAFVMLLTFSAYRLTNKKLFCRAHKSVQTSPVLPLSRFRLRHHKSLKIKSVKHATSTEYDVVVNTNAAHVLSGLRSVNFVNVTK